MKNNKILEYYEGNPDGIIDNSDNKVVTNYCDDDAISFGYFPIDIYGSYEFLIGGDMHIMLAGEACNKLIGKAKYHISDDYYAFLRDQCYDKSYGLGRYWEKSGLIAFWALPTKKYLKDVIIKLNLSLDDYIVIKENEAEENITIREYLGGDYDGEDDEIEARSTPFRIDPKIKDIIEKYNEPDKSWQIQKEKSGWDTIAQRNAMIYQEGKERINEYFCGDPDTIKEFDDESCEQIDVAHFEDPGVLSFGFFQSEMNTPKEFMYSVDKSHHEMSQECAKKYIGMAANEIDKETKRDIAAYIYSNAAYKGRIFLAYHVITSWHRFSSKSLANILNKLEGGVEKYQNWIYLTDWSEEYKVSDYINKNDPGDEQFEAGKMKTPVEMYLSQELVEKIKQCNTPDSSWAAAKEKSGWNTLAQRNAMIYQEGKERINEYFTGNPDEVYDTDKSIHHTWDNGSAITFGYFPTSLDDEYEFMCKENVMHLWLANEAAKKVIGHSLEYIRDAYGYGAALKVKNKVGDECNRRGYCKGRYWSYPKNKTPYPSLITFWDTPSSEQLKNICEKLNIDVDKTIFVRGRLGSMTVKKYIDEGYNGDKCWEFEEAPNWKLSEKLIEIIKNYHNPSDSWAAEKEKSGWPTLAQRNAMIYQEGKEPKKDIKENNKHMKKNNYTKEFSNYLQIMSEALDKKDFAVYDAAKEMLEETVDDCKREDALLKEMNTTNFGVLNHIFEEALPTLIKTNKKAVRNVIKTIKEDKNLMAEFNFYNLIDKYNSKISEMVTPEMMFQKLNETILEKIDPKEVRESNKKLKKVMVESGIVPLSHVGEEKMKLYESGHYMLSTAPSMTNVFGMYESRNDVINYMEAHKNDVVVEAVKPEKLIKDFENTLKEKLTESEISFVQQITDFRSPIAEQRKEKLFNKFKNECIDKINEMLKEDKDNVELKGLSDQINEMTFNKETIVKDIAKLLEIRDILLDE